MALSAVFALNQAIGDILTGSLTEIQRTTHNIAVKIASILHSTL
jgi:hypothetical protein